MSISAAQRTRLGVFIVASVALILFVFAAGIGVRLSQETAVYYSEFRGESLSGLSKGMEVKFRGIPIGKVTKINYDPDNMESVVVQLEVEKEFPMKDDMIVQTGMLGITGLKYIEIMGGSNAASVVEEGSMLESKASLMSTLTENVESIVAKVDVLLNNLNSLTNPDSLTQIGSILTNVDNLTQNLNTTLENSSPRLDSMTMSLNRTLANVDSMVNSFSQSGMGTKIIADVDSTIVSIKELSENFNLTFVQSREDLSATMLDLREAMENVNNLSQLLLENPSLILRGSPQQKRKIK